MPDGLLSRLSRQPPCSQNTLAASDRPAAVFQPLARVFILVAAETLSKRPCRPRHPYSLLSPILLLFFRCLLPCPIRTRVSLRSRMARFCGRATASFFRSCAPAGAPPPSGNLPEKYRKTTGFPSRVFLSKCGQNHETYLLPRAIRLHAGVATRQGSCLARITGAFAPSLCVKWFH